MHQNRFLLLKIIIDVLNSRLLLNQSQSNILNENIQRHFQTKFFIKHRLIKAI